MRPNSEKKPTGLRRLMLANGNSMRGFRGAWTSEAAFRQECMAAFVMVPLGLWFGNTAAERAILTMPILLLIVVELLNTGIEVAIDRIGTDHNPLSGLAKDVASAAVLLTIYLALFGWALVLYDRYLA
jgi:diacylglycerol kinase (ATP)